jgi:hypothetical protein
MSEFPFELAPSHLANLLLLAGLVLVCFGLFSRDGEQSEWNRKFRIGSLVVGVAILAYAYGIRFHHQSPASHSKARAEAAEPQTGSRAAPQPASAPLPPPVAASPAPATFFAGNWRNADPVQRHVVFLRVEQSGERLNVRAWGSCADQVCDWGSEQAELEQGVASVRWEQSTVRQHMQLLPDGGQLRVVLDSDYRDGRPGEHCEEHFERR